MHPVRENQLWMVKLGVIVGREFPSYNITTVEELRLFLNDQLGLNIQVGDEVKRVYHEVEAKINERAFNRARV